MSLPKPCLSTTGTSMRRKLFEQRRILGAAGADLDHVDAGLEEGIEVPQVDQLG